MSTDNKEVAGFRFDLLKWLLVVAIVLGGAYANSVLDEQFALLYRFVALVVAGLVAAFIAINTQKGNSFWELLKASQLELRKVVWPTRQETNQTTLLVVVVVIIAAIILWALDALFGLVASLIIG